MTQLEGQGLGASLTATDIQKSLAWYRDMLGFAVDREHERDGKVFAISLRAGSARILLTQDDGAKGTDRVKGEGISLMITTAQDIDAIADGFKARGGAFLVEPMTTRFGARMFRVKDPDGFTLVVSNA